MSIKIFNLSEKREMRIISGFSQQIVVESMVE